MSNEPLVLDKFVEVVCAGQRYSMCDHWFWPQLNEGTWEPSTQRIYSKYITPDRAYIDIGTWVGPAILYAVAAGAQRVYGIEGNPDTHRHLLASIAQNPRLHASVQLISNLCVDSTSGRTVSFGSPCYLSSISSMRHSGYSVTTTTLREWIAQHQIQDIGLIKIDIEGAEANILEDLRYLSTLPRLAVLFSPHPSYWEDAAEVTPRLLEALSHYTVLDSDEQPISPQEIAKRCLTKETHPAWGTKHGNFFELLLLTK